MNAAEERTVKLRTAIPVYLGYWPHGSRPTACSSSAATSTASTVASARCWPIAIQAAEDRGGRGRAANRPRVGGTYSEQY